MWDTHKWALNGFQHNPAAILDKVRVLMNEEFKRDLNSQHLVHYRLRSNKGTLEPEDQQTAEDFTSDHCKLEVDEA